MRPLAQHHSQTPSVLRPPWTDEARVRENCTSCGDCIAACPEAILASGRAGTPVVELDGGVCTFCGDCAAVCKDDVFRPKSGTPWNIVASIDKNCLLVQGVSCQSCTDSCDDNALSFDYRRGRVGAVVVTQDLCTGCGACLSVCPTAAITLASKFEKETS